MQSISELLNIRKDIKNLVDTAMSGFITVQKCLSLYYFLAFKIPDKKFDKKTFKVIKT